MTCFWDGIYAALEEQDFQLHFRAPKPASLVHLIEFLKDNAQDTNGILWNGETLIPKLVHENRCHINEFDATQIGDGYDCPCLDPFLALVCQLFHVNIEHMYNGNSMQYKHRAQHHRKTLHFTSDTGHFQYVKTTLV